MIESTWQEHLTFPKTPRRKRLLFLFGFFHHFDPQNLVSALGIHIILQSPDAPWDEPIGHRTAQKMGGGARASEGPFPVAFGIPRFPRCP